MGYFTEQLLNGLSLGTVYALIAIGFAIVYGLLRFLNFAHSEVFTSGCFCALISATFLMDAGMPAAVVLLGALAAAVSGAGLLAIAIEFVAYRPFRRAPRVYVFLSAVGVSVILQIVGIRMFGAQTRGFPDIHIGIDPRLVALGTLVICLTVLFLVVYRTTFGLQMRAVALDSETSKLMGISPNRVFVLAFLLGGTLAGIAGLVWGLLYGIAHPQMGFVPGLKSFLIAVIGGIGRLWGTVAAGISLGVLETLVGAYLPSDVSGLREPIVFVTLLVILVWRPDGLLGSPSNRERV